MALLGFKNYDNIAVEKAIWEGGKNLREALISGGPGKHFQKPLLLHWL